jgi:hypothetical protein
MSSTRVARWFIFEQKIQIRVYWRALCRM